MPWPLSTPTGLMPACDIDLASFDALVQKTASLSCISSYKVGFALGLSAGLPRVVETARKWTDKPLIYDHQKAGTDIPATGKVFARTLKQAGIDAAILFPQAGPITHKAWIEALREEGLGVIVGGWMSHPGYTEKDGGYLRDEGILDIYRDAADAGVEDFVGPGNQPDVVAMLRAMLVERGVTPTFHMPGLLTQGGDILSATEAAGSRWQAIIGRAITQADDPVAAIQAFWPHPIGHQGANA